jgi:hypothetical protein
MWLILTTALATGAWAYTRSREQRAGVFAVGAVLLLLEGMLGMATGMKAVAAFAHHPRFAILPDPATVVATGLGELSNNGLLAVGCAILVGLGAILTRRRPASASA